jgi:hypothetical protein
MAASYRSGSYSGLGASIQANKQAQKSHATVPLNIKHIYGSRFSFCIILGVNNLIISKKWQKCMYIYSHIYYWERGINTGTKKAEFDANLSIEMLQKRYPETFTNSNKSKKRLFSITNL